MTACFVLNTGSAAFNAAVFADHGNPVSLGVAVVSSLCAVYCAIRTLA